MTKVTLRLKTRKKPKKGQGGPEVEEKVEIPEKSAGRPFPVQQRADNLQKQQWHHLVPEKIVKVFREIKLLTSTQYQPSDLFDERVRAKRKN